jgi:hypothetical protein
MNTKIELSKFEVARRQLETAVLLYFRLGDPVSIHTLAAAAYNVLADVNAKYGGVPMLKKLITLLNTEEARDFGRRLNEVENFYKHANRHTNSLYRFDPEYSEFLMLEACEKYMEMTEQQPPMLVAFRAWFVFHHADVIPLSPELQGVVRELARTSAAKSRGHFLEMVLPMLVDPEAPDHSVEPTP